MNNVVCVCVFFLRGTISDDVGSLVGEEGELCCSFVFLVTGGLNEAERGDLSVVGARELNEAIFRRCSNRNEAIFGVFCIVRDFQ